MSKLVYRADIVFFVISGYLNGYNYNGAISFVLALAPEL